MGDIHAHSSASNSFMYCNSSTATRDREFPRLLSARAPDFKFHQTKFDQDPSKEGTGRRELGAIMPGVRCYTLEVSFFAAVQKTGRAVPYTQHSYMELGKCVALTFADLYKLDSDAASRK